MENKPINVLAFAREAGGAAAISPVCKSMYKKGWNLLLLAKDYAQDYFANQKMNFETLAVFNKNRLTKLVQERFRRLPDIIFTSATSLPHLDMTERLMWKWAKRKGIPVVALLDQWNNYTIRFSGISRDSRLAHLPDYIFVMDKMAKEDMVKEGLPQEIIRITGQPAFESIEEKKNTLSKKINEIRRKIAIPEGYLVLTFAAEALKKDFKGSLGYDEQSILEFLGNMLEEISQKNNLKLFLLIRLHPHNLFREFLWVFSRWSALPKKIITKEINTHENIIVSDIVIGMSSAMLIESMLLDRPTVSFQLGSRRESALVLTRTKAIPYIRTKAIAKKILNKILINADYRKQYLARQHRWKVTKKATKNCIIAIKKIIDADKKFN